MYIGGILAIARHISEFAKKVKLVTLLGDKDNYLKLIKKKLNKNITFKYFTKYNSYTTLKKRYVNKQRNEKLFKVEFLNDSPISYNLSKKICDFLKKEIPKYDLVVVGDFGHGFINEEIKNILQKKSKYLAVNVQTNSANLGFNFVTKYDKVDFISMDVRELQYAVSDQFSKYIDLVNKLKKLRSFDNILLTMGKKGSLLSNKNGNFFFPTFGTKVSDTVGAGDAVFSLSSLLCYKKINDELIPFYSNCAGGVAVKIMGNKESINKTKLLRFIKEIYKNEME